MCNILNIETSTPVCSVTLSRRGKVLYNKLNREGDSHASILGVFVAEAIQFARENGHTLDAVAVSAGPGSYTGLRIGVSEAKGLCYGLNIPLIAIPSLKILTKCVTLWGFDADYFCPMIDARRMEVYAAIYDRQLNEVRKTAADIVNEETYAPYLEQGKMLFFGNGAAKCKTVISSPNAIFLNNFHPLSSAMISLSEAAFRNREFVDIAYFEPFYLKEFVAIAAKNKVI